MKNFEADISQNIVYYNGILTIIKIIKNLTRLKNLKIDLSYNILGDKVIWLIYEFVKVYN